MQETIENNKAKKLLTWGILLLVVVIAVFSFLNRSQDNLQEGQLLVKVGDNQLALLTIADLQQLPAVEKKMVINSSRGKSEHQFTCIELREVLDNIDSGLTSQYDRIITRGIDNYTSGLDMSEVMQPDNVYIAYADRGKPLKTKTGAEGSMRIIIITDEFGQRFTNFLVSIELE
jgi:DMSO/TMAO reductase YedYZ molybdopterin-dependent catalytic subunit